MGNSDPELKKTKEQREKRGPKREIIGECVPCEGIYAIIALMVSGSGECHAPSSSSSSSSSSSFFFYFLILRLLLFPFVVLDVILYKRKGIFVFPLFAGNPAPSIEYDEHKRNFSTESL